MKRPIFYDTETTGIKAESDFIIEIAAYDPVNDKTFESFVNPGKPIPQEATAIHHITDEMVKDAPDFSEVGKQFIEFCSEEVVLIAHNNDAFDVHFLREEFKRHNLDMPPWNYFDTLKWARRYRPDLPRHSLQFLREIYGIEANNAHRALDDVIVLYQLYKHMVQDLSVDQLLELINQKKKPKNISHMPFGKHQGMPLNKLPKNYVTWLAGSGALEKEENTDLKNSFMKLGLIA